MDRVGILIVSKCLSSPAIVDAFSRSQKHRCDFYVVEKQANPFNLARAKVHAIVPDLNLRDVARFAKRHGSSIDFGFADTEEFVVQGGRDVLEEEAGVKMVSVTKEYAVEGSKAGQRLLFDRISPGFNPRFKVFDPARYGDVERAVSDFRRWAGEVRSVVIKPDAPARGAGVGVGGSDFRTEGEMTSFFRGVYHKGKVLVEEKIEGEESSFQAFSDGKHFVPAPMTRDYKRALDDDEGRLTGGMGSFRDDRSFLPFVRSSEWESVTRAEDSAFRKWKGKGSKPGLRGIVLYDALMHTGSGFKVLERNSRGGNTEFVNLLTTLGDDFVDVCFRILDGSLKGMRFRREASVVTCAVPLSYGKGDGKDQSGQEIDITKANRLVKEHPGECLIYPMDLRLDGGRMIAGTSRSVAAVGLGEEVEQARNRSLEVVKSIAGPVRWREDIASRKDLGKRAAHLDSLRREVG
ncbi:MAG: hypothetical protein KGI38_09345 [Thaumarchaeota archaeon]|nr:hypothetical protein [Nitrososphaerota archaeon]